VIYVEALLAFLIGSAALMLILLPLLRPAENSPAPAWELPELEETRKGQALIALKEIEFDLATGKLSDADFNELKRKFTNEAVAAMREEGEGAPAPVKAGSGTLTCRRCGPRPETDAIYCSTCGSRLGEMLCAGCGAALPSGAKFCEGCGRAAA
jgi:hypothetical protein